MPSGELPEILRLGRKPKSAHQTKTLRAVQDDASSLAITLKRVVPLGDFGESAIAEAHNPPLISYGAHGYFNEVMRSCHEKFLVRPPEASDSIPRRTPQIEL